MTLPVPLGTPTLGQDCGAYVGKLSRSISLEGSYEPNITPTHRKIDEWMDGTMEGTGIELP